MVESVWLTTQKRCISDLGQDSDDDQLNDRFQDSASLETNDAAGKSRNDKIGKSHKKKQKV